MPSKLAPVWPPANSFWVSFKERTDGGTRPVLFKGLVPVDVVGPRDVLDGFRRVRRAMATDEPSDARVRVYVGEERRDDLVSDVVSAPWPDSQEFLPWMQETVSAERFSLIINNLETTNERLASRLGEFVQWVFKGWGVPIGGCEQAAFIGNYSGTAFGVHEGYEDAFLIHLGPGVKDFYCWSQEAYTQLAGTTEPTFGDYRWMLLHGEKFVLEAGDVLFLPRRVYHVGVQTDLSVSVAVPLYTYPHARLLARSVLPEVLESMQDESFDTPSPMHDLSRGPNPLARSLAAVLNDLMSTLSAQAEALLPLTSAARWNAVQSNGGWEVVTNDLARRDAVDPDVPTEQVLMAGSAVRLRRPYRICWSPDQVSPDGRHTVYLRGLAAEVTGLPELSDLFDQLNAGEEVRVPDSAPAVEILQTLCSTGGLVVPLRDGKERK